MQWSKWLECWANSTVLVGWYTQTKSTSIMTLEHFLCNMEAILSFTWHFVIYFSSVLDYCIYYTLFILFPMYTPYKMISTTMNERSLQCNYTVVILTASLVCTTLLIAVHQADDDKSSLVTTVDKYSANFFK